MKFTRSGIFNLFAVLTSHENSLIGRFAVAYRYTQFFYEQKKVCRPNLEGRLACVNSRPFATFEYKSFQLHIAAYVQKPISLVHAEVNCPIKLTINLQSYDLITFS